MYSPVVNTLIVSSLTLSNHISNIIVRLMYNLKEKLNSQLKMALIIYLFVNLKMTKVDIQKMRSDVED